MKNVMIQEKFMNSRPRTTPNACSRFFKYGQTIKNKNSDLEFESQAQPVFTALKQINESRKGNDKDTLDSTNWDDILKLN